MDRTPDVGNRTSIDSPHATSPTMTFSTIVPISWLAENHDRAAAVREANCRTCYEDYRLTQVNSSAIPALLLHCIRLAMMAWLHDRALTLVLMAMFLIFLLGQYVTGYRQYNESQQDHQLPEIALPAYFATGHWWEGVFENWESEFLQMAVFVLLTTMLVQKGSPESRRAHIKELVDAD